MNLTKTKAPKGQENLKDALGNFVYAQAEESLESKLKPEVLSKKDVRELKLVTLG
jgi:nitrous oxide reductase accessory protein NosL